MMNLRTLLLVAAAALAFPAFAEEAKPADKKSAASKEPAKEEPKAAEPAKEYTILKLGSEEIKSGEVVDVWRGLFPSGSAPDFESFDENIRQNVLRGLVSERLIYQEAVKSGLDKSDEVKKRVAAMEKQVIMQSYMEQKAKSLVSDDQLKTAYNKKVAELKGQEELKARHILVGSEEDAKKIAGELKKGGDFDKIAKEKSTDKASGENGGDLGWFTKDRMIPEFSDAAYKLKKGEISAPIKTSFGWHIIKLDDRRPVQAPSFDEMKEALRGEVTNKAVQGYVEELLKKADVKYFGADGKERTFSRELKPAAGKAEKKADKQ